MESMNVQEMTDRLKVRYKRISPATKVLWDKSIKYIADLDVSEVDDDVAADYLEHGMQKAHGARAQSNAA